MGPLERRMVDYALALQFDDLGTATLHQAKRRIIDTIGCAIGAYTAPPCRIARQWAAPVAAGPTARVFGSMVETTPEAAAFANGTMLRYLDLNDTHRTVDGSHPSDNLGGILAVAEMLGASGADFILALAISYEIQCRFVDSVPFNDNGWDQPVPGVMACALACGRLLDMDADELGHALALAIIPNLCTYQTRAGELSMWKGSAAANGARQGVFAARLAELGMTGPYEAFDGVFGLWNQTMEKAFDIAPFATAGGTFGIGQTNIKKYPVRDSCQLPVDTALALREQVAATDIAALRIDTYSSAHKGAVADPELWAPQTRETADHSMLFSVVCGLIDGTVTADSFTSKRFLDGDILDLIGRTSVEIDAEFSSQTPATRNCRLIAETHAGDTLTAHLKWTAEDIARGPSDDMIVGKFRAVTAPFLPPDAQERVLDIAWDLENLADVGVLVDALRI